MGRMRRYIPSMFHRRLALLGAVLLVGFVPLSVRLMWLTGVKGAEARELAEERLVRQTWLPTIRGRILDRQGRVLAQDRPSYDIAVSYEVLSGEWARERARWFAYRANRDVWGTLDEAGKRELTERYLPAYEARVARMWELIAQGTGTPPEELRAARERAVRRVDAVQADYTARTAERERGRLVERGIAIGADEEARIAKIASAPVREKTVAHAIVRGVTDDVGFRFMRLGEREQAMFVAGEVGDAALDEVQPLMPGRTTCR